MFFIPLFLLVLLCEIVGGSLISSVNEQYYKSILTSLQVNELNLTTLNGLLIKLKLQNCSTTNLKKPDCRHRVSTFNILNECFAINYV